MGRFRLFDGYHWQFYIYAYLVPFTAISVFLFFTPNQLIQSINSYFNLTLPDPLGNFYALVYASAAAFISFLGPFFVAKAVKGDPAH